MLNAKKFKEVRLKRGLNLLRVSKSTQIPAYVLRQFENGKIDLSLNEIHRLRIFYAYMPTLEEFQAEKERLLKELEEKIDCLTEKFLSVKSTEDLLELSDL
mgnify:CR=1 FL=1